MDTSPDPTTTVSDATFREFQSIRCLEAAVGMLASPNGALTLTEIATLQTASRSAANPQLRDLARRILDLWADEREPALAGLVAGNSCDLTGEASAKTDSGGVIYFDAWRDRRAARRSWDPLQGDTGRPCLPGEALAKTGDTEEPVLA